ncbi:TPA: hypothetical protein QB290_001243 [Pasteurella multocida]|uniref:hypothetical protein n=1 Tax=Pasteurella multocida TaxID=747 RepID=UPI00021450A9|nr:hypothetical protein [Pasteurella multocida]EGP03027.1 hypothetical protein AAUPMG_11781 [Pasteurella multocida subsp. multocida str. Anand1_goat]AUK49440.1 hypothetical protein A4210_06680 [Pasteurella multocida]AUK54049.1 hypothetical protein A4204_06685 [Pasteurella multocida]EPE67435.1 hypothetical protein I141_08768 [Pasteurella multocida P1933]MCL7838609.1 hypothetical protein [Pasteurella multocida]
MAFTDFPVFDKTSSEVNEQGIAEVRAKMHWETNPAVRQFNKFYRDNQATFIEISKRLGWEVKDSLEKYSLEERIEIAETIRLLKPFITAFSIPVRIQDFKNAEVKNVSHQ